MNERIEQSLKVVTHDNHTFNLSTHDSPENAGNPLIVCLPAMGMAGRHYSQFASSLALNGYTVFVADLRGLGSSSLRASRKSNFGYLQLVAYDVASMVEQIRLSYPGRKLYLLGHSLGGQLSVMYAGMCPDAVDGLILIACGSVFYKNWHFPQNIQILLSTQLVRAITTVFGYFPGQRFGFGGIEAKNVIRDWSHLAITGRFEPIGSVFNFEASFEQPQLPILAISLAGDWFAPQASLKNLCNKLINSHPSFYHLCEPETPRNTLHHFKWIRYSQPIEKKIDKWLRAME